MASTCGFDSIGQTRVAYPGYDCTVDTALGLWGFCPTTVDAAAECGLAGFCVDESACSTGCGPLDNVSGITTFTCTASNYCSVVISENGAGQSYEYVACGAKETTETIYATPPVVSASTTSDTSITSTPMTSSTPTGSPSTTPPAASTASTSTTSPPASTTSNSTTAPSSGMSSATSAILSSTQTASEATTTGTGSDGSWAGSTDIGPMVGGVLGGLAIICLTVLAVFFIRRRKAHSDFSRSHHSADFLRDRREPQYHDYGFLDPSQLHGSYSKETEGDRVGLHEADAMRSPVELSGQ